MNWAKAPADPLAASHGLATHKQRTIGGQSMSFIRNTTVSFVAASLLAGCGSLNSLSSGSLFGGRSAGTEQAATIQAARVRGAEQVAVNRYIWAAALDVLSFLPIQSVDPFTGVIVTGYGTPPGGSRAYRANIHVKDPALAARSLSLALMTRSGPVNPATVRAVEDAILTRARQLRIADRGL